MAILNVLSIFLVACAAVCVHGQTVPPERNEQGDLRFYYDPDSHYFVLALHSTCYMVPLTHAERDHVHTSHGIEDLELKMMRDWLGILTETKIFKDDRFLPKNIRSWCDRHDIFLLTRETTQSTTISSIIG